MTGNKFNGITYFLKGKRSFCAVLLAMIFLFTTSIAAYTVEPPTADPSAMTYGGKQDVELQTVAASVYNTTDNIVSNVVYASDFAGGDGSVDNPYQVATAEQLNNVRNHLDKHFIQTADIDLGVEPYNTGAGWEPIGNDLSPFTGTFDGNGKIISKLTIMDTGSYVGLFGFALGSHIKNVKLEDVNVTGDYQVGGLVGDNKDGEITNSYATGAVIGTGGDEVYVGGLVGYNFDTDTVSNSYWDKETSGMDSSAGGAGAVGKNTKEMKQRETYVDWDFDNIWSIDTNKNKGYPFLTGNPPVELENPLTITAATGGSITTGSSSNYPAGTVINITATPASGYSFNKWTSTGGGTFANANSASTTYTMPANPATITATFTYNSSSGGSPKGGGSTTPSGTQVTSSGRTFSQNGVTLTFLAGAVESDIQVQIKETALSAGMTLPDNSQLLSRIMDIVKDKSGNFLKPVTITLSFDNSGLDPNEYDIAIYYYDEDTGKWIALDNIRLNLKAGTISGDTNHFTKFAVIATPKTIKEEKPAKPVTPQPTVNIPPDISGHWAKDSIMKLINAGVISDYPDGTFKPDKAVTRAEFTVMIVKALNLETRAGKTFTDTASHWAKDSIATAAAHGIISGYDENIFGPDDLITREQAAVIIARAAKLEAVNGELTFTDSKAISPWAKPGVAAAFKGGFISGYPDNSFRPQGNTTRAEAVSLILKAI